MIPRIALAVFFAFLGYLVYSADQGKWPELFAFYNAIPLGDKVGHFFLAGTFAFLATWVLKAKAFSIGRRRVPLGSTVVFLVVCLEELSQIFVPGRTFSLFDLSADLAGIAVFGWLAAWLYRRGESKPEAVGNAAQIP